MVAAIIDYKPGIKKPDQTLLLKRTLKNCKTEYKENNISIKKYYLPIIKEAPSEKALQKFCAFLKSEDVVYIYVTEAVKAIPTVYHILEKNFSFFTGLSVINYKSCDIIRKYAGMKDKKLSDSSLLIETDNPEKADILIHQIYRRVKRISIQTKFEDKFTKLCDTLLKEYGLFIAINSDEEQDIHVELDSLLLPSDNLNLSGDENRANQILFKLQNKKEYNQFYLEFLIYSAFGMVNKKTVQKFFDQHSVKISKIL